MLTTATQAQTVLLVDDNATNLKVLHKTLAVLGHKLLIAKSGEGALKVAARATPDLVLLDINMPPGIDGYETCRRLKADPATREAAIIFLSAQRDTQDKVKGLSLGAVDFVGKPFQAEEIIARVQTHLKLRRLSRELASKNARLEQDLEVERALLKEARQRVEGPLLGDGPAVIALRAEIDRLGAEPGTVLLMGPPGAGQETVARAIHHASSRGSRVFIFVNCTMLRASTSTAILQVTDADGADPTRRNFELARGGTLYLDGVDRLGAEFQAELADLLEIDAAAPRLDVRLIASSTVDLDQARQSGGIDPRLYRLLTAEVVQIPALRDRREDMATLVGYYLRQHALRLGKAIEGVTDDTMARLQQYRWPGNVEELDTLLQRSVMSAQNTSILEIDESALDESASVGSYRLVTKLGAGGMGEVWKARHQLLARPAAIKLIRPDALGGGAQSDELLSRFRREAQSTARLRSPHTVELYDFGISEGGGFYYVMECLSGMDLEELVVQHGVLSPARVVYLMRQVCRSLSEAHQLGLIHRDIKPANIFACQLGIEYDFIKVLDFGMVTTDATGDTKLTAVGRVVGTSAYMAPEMAMAKAGMDGRVDVYALGCVMFWLLVGDLVFEAETAMAMLMAHVTEEPKPPSEVTEQPVPPELDAVVLSCLVKDPKERPTIDGLYEALLAVPLQSPWDEVRAKRWWTQHRPAAREPDGESSLGCGADPSPIV